MYASYIPMVMQFLLMAMVSRTVAIYGSHWGRLDKKAVDNDTVATPLNVEASQHWDGNDGPWSSFILQIGTPAQNVRVLISTAGYNTWAVNADLGCPNGTVVGCEASRGTPFMANESLTWIQNSIWDLGLEANLGLDSTSDFGFDTVKLGWQGTQVATVEHSVIANFGVSTYWLGIFGLNPMPTNFSTFNGPQPSFISQLRNSSNIPSLSWSYTAGNQYRFSGDQYGSLVLGGYDQSKFSPVNISIPFANDVSRDLVIGVQSMTTSASATTLTEESGGFYAFIDSTVAQLWLPIEICETFEKVFGLTWDEDSELYLVNDTLHTQLQNQNASVTFTLGALSSGGDTIDIVLPYAAFDLQVSYPLQANKTFYFPLKRAANATQYTLGRTFLQEAYLVADYERRNFTVAPCAWVLNAKSDIRTIYPVDLKAEKDESDGLSTSAIVGIVVGSVVALVLLAVVLWFVRRRSRKRLQLAQTASTPTQGRSREGNNPYSEEVFSPFLGVHAKSELDSGSVIHEMQASGTSRLPEMEAEDGMAREKKAHEVEGSNTPVYEMVGSDVHELPGSTWH